MISPTVGRMLDISYVCVRTVFLFVFWLVPKTCLMQRVVIIVFILLKSSMLKSSPVVQKITMFMASNLS